jgi:hypothetical protein
MSQPRKLILLALVFYGILVGVLPYALSEFFGLQTDPRKVRVAFYPWNFSPQCAISLFVAATLKDWWKALLIPVAIRVGTDFGIWLITQDIDLAIYPYQAMVYFGLFLFIAIGLLLRMENSPLSLKKATTTGQRALRIGGAGFAAEFLFFIVSNFGSWLMYDTFPHTPAGLLACYIVAIPFFGRSLASTLVYCGMIFGAYAWHEERVVNEERPLAAQRIE